MQDHPPIIIPLLDNAVGLSCSKCLYCIIVRFQIFFHIHLIRFVLEESDRGLSHRPDEIVRSVVDDGQYQENDEIGFEHMIVLDFYSFDGFAYQ